MSGRCTRYSTSLGNEMDIEDDGTLFTTRLRYAPEKIDGSRCKRHNLYRLFIEELLNEPNQDLGCHIGEKIMGKLSAPAIRIKP